MSPEFGNPKERCKYQIICPNKPTSLDCNPSICDTFSRAEKQISGKELGQAIAYELYREDMCDY